MKMVLRESWGNETTKGPSETHEVSIELTFVLKHLYLIITINSRIRRGSAMNQVRVFPIHDNKRIEMTTVLPSHLLNSLNGLFRVNRLLSYFVLNLDTDILRCWGYELAT